MIHRWIPSSLVIFSGFSLCEMTKPVFYVFYGLSSTGCLLLFLVGAFLGKSARLLQWLVFFFFFSSDHRPHCVCTTFYRLHSRSHVLVSTRFTVNPAVTGSSPGFSQKLFRAIFFGTVRLFQFFRHCATFFRNFKRSPLSSFLAL